MPNTLLTLLSILTLISCSGSITLPGGASSNPASSSSVQGSSPDTQNPSKPQVDGEAIQGRKIITAQNAKLLCGQERLSEVSHRVKCNAAYADDSGTLVVGTDLAPGVALSWEDPALISGPTPLSTSCVVDASGLAQNCNITLQDPARVEYKFAMGVADIIANSKREESAIIVLPYEMNLFGAGTGFVGDFSQAYTVPMGKTLVIQSAVPIVDVGFTDCNVGRPQDKGKLFQIASRRVDPAKGFTEVPMVNPLAFPEGESLLVGGASGSIGGNTPSKSNCNFSGVLLEKSTYTPPGTFKGFIDIVSTFRLSPAPTYTVPQGKKFILTGSVGSFVNSASIQCKATAANSTTPLQFLFSLIPNAILKPISDPIIYPSGTQLTFQGILTTARGSTGLPAGRCSWTGYEASN